ncbi:MAG: hypothetical protein V9E96_08310 [Chitinophagaceae bacterium]
MQQQVTLKLQPQEAASNSIVKEYIAKTIGVPENSITGFYVLKQSIDAQKQTTSLGKYYCSKFLLTNHLFKELFSPYNLKM